jgi:hypothetical protein
LRPPRPTALPRIQIQTTTPIPRKPECPGTCITGVLSFTCFSNAALTDLFECDDQKSCCSPKTAIKEREMDLQRIQRNQQYQQYQNNKFRQSGSQIDKNDNLGGGGRYPSSSVPGERPRPQQQGGRPDARRPELEQQVELQIMFLLAKEFA